LVHVFEKRPSAGEPAVEWLLLVGLPVDTPDAIAYVVAYYRDRWTIEEFFKALKTGCQYERRQLESAKALLNALTIFAPVAGGPSASPLVPRETPEKETHCNDHLLRAWSFRP
jgi:hypothetical protein